MREIKTINDESTNLWNTGVKSTSFHLLPVKGNYDVLLALNRNINQNILLPNELGEEKEEERKMDFEEEEKIEGNEIIPENKKY